MHLHLDVILFAIHPILKMFDSFLKGLGNCSINRSDLMLCTASDTFKIILAHSTLSFFQVYASIFNHIQRYKAYLCVLRHY